MLRDVLGFRAGETAEMLVPEPLIAAIAAAKATDDLGTPVVEQLALADFLARGELDRHLRRTRAIYRARRDALVAALAQHLPGCTPAGVASATAASRSPQSSRASASSPPRSRRAR